MVIDLSCQECGTELPASARICPRCGAAPRGAPPAPDGETVELPADPVLPDPNVTAAPADRPPSIHLTHRQPLGLHPVPLLTGLGGICLLLGIVLLGVGDVVAGVIVLVLAVVMLTLLRFAVRREPEAPLAAPLLRVAGRSRSSIALTGVSLRTTWRAALDLLRIRGRQWQLRNELQGQLRPLGEAVHNDDHARAERLKRHATALEQKLHATERDASAVIDAARRTIRRERAASEQTEAISVPPDSA
jgi:hypothetical protein